MEQIYLSRRNLLVLLSKLDRVAAGEVSECTLIKADTNHSIYLQTIPLCAITAVEDRDYYIDRKPGPMAPEDEIRLSTKAKIGTLGETNPWPWRSTKDTLAEDIPD